MNKQQWSGRHSSEPLRLVQPAPERDRGMEMLARLFLYGGVVGVLALAWWLA